MRRRQVVLALVGWASVLGGMPQAGAQSRALVIGLLEAGGGRKDWWDSFRNEMAKLGHSEARGVRYEYRSAEGRLDALPSLAHELVQLNVAAIVTSGTAAAQAAKKATDSVPIVMATGADQVSLGLVDSLARPGGNVTGVTSLMSELTGKRLEVLRELVPKMTRIGVLWHPDNATSSTVVRDLQVAATKPGIALQNLRVRKTEDLTSAFEAMAKARVDAVFVVHSPYIYRERRAIATLALKHRIPGMFGATEYAEDGGLVSYAPNYADLFRRAAGYLDRIVKGAKPGDLPIEQPTRLDLVINGKTAKALGVAIPLAMATRATRIVD
jgi:putative ABC transport system substrate-binding protein